MLLSKKEIKMKQWFDKSELWRIFRNEHRDLYNEMILREHREVGDYGKDLLPTIDRLIEKRVCDIVALHYERNNDVRPDYRKYLKDPKVQEEFLYWTKTSKEQESERKSKENAEKRMKNQTLLKAGLVIVGVVCALNGVLGIAYPDYLAQSLVFVVAGALLIWLGVRKKK